MCGLAVGMLCAGAGGVYPLTMGLGGGAGGTRGGHLSCLLWSCSRSLCGNSLSRPSDFASAGHRGASAGHRLREFQKSWHRPCVEPMLARRRPAVSNMFNTAGRPTPARSRSSGSAMMNFWM